MASCQDLRVVEFYSGIGGMHFALKSCGIVSSVVGAVDINTAANYVYKHNFPGTPLLNRNIESLSTSDYDKLRADVFLMSPPCQPFTRQGLQGDGEDRRTHSFLHMLELLPRMEHKPSYILIENVKGFDTSSTRARAVSTLSACDYQIQEFLLSPLQFGIPNSRLRYYMLAWRHPHRPPVPVSDQIRDYLPSPSQTKEQSCADSKSVFGEHAPLGSSGSSSGKSPDGIWMNEEQRSSAGIGFGAVDRHPKCQPLENFLIKEPQPDLLLPNKLLRRFGKILDVVSPTSCQSCCFTKGYGHYVEGTGSVLKTTDEDVDAVFREFHAEQAAERADESACVASSDRPCALNRLGLRYFSAREVANLMCFPEHFSFPSDVTVRQRFRLLGNSLNVLVVSRLLGYLFHNCM